MDSTLERREREYAKRGIFGEAMDFLERCAEQQGRGLAYGLTRDLVDSGDRALLVQIESASVDQIEALNRAAAR